MFSESDIDGEYVDVLLKQSCKDIQQGLCNVEICLMRLVERDEIDPGVWLASNECNITLLNLVKELIDIMKSIKPSSKSLKICREKIDDMVEKDKQNN